jgi:hypothetical protein
MQKHKLHCVLMVMCDGVIRLNPGALDDIQLHDLTNATFVVVKRPDDVHYVVYKERYDLVKHNTPLSCEKMLDVASEHQRRGQLIRSTRSALDEL